VAFCETDVGKLNVSVSQVEMQFAVEALSSGVMSVSYIAKPS